MGHSNNIKLGVGAVVFHDDSVLLVQRNKPPYQNQWAIPGGMVEFGETLQHAAEREILEETGITIKAGEPIFSFDIIQQEQTKTTRHYVVIDLLAEYIEGTPQAGDDAQQAAWISKQQLYSLDVNHMTLQLLKDKFNY